MDTDVRYDIQRSIRMCPRILMFRVCDALMQRPIMQRSHAASNMALRPAYRLSQVVSIKLNHPRFGQTGRRAASLYFPGIRVRSLTTSDFHRQYLESPFSVAIFHYTLNMVLHMHTYCLISAWSLSLAKLMVISACSLSLAKLMVLSTNQVSSESISCPRARSIVSD